MNFDDDRLRGFRAAGPNFTPYIDFDRRPFVLTTLSVYLEGHFCCSNPLCPSATVVLVYDGVLAE